MIAKSCCSAAQRGAVILTAVILLLTLATLVTLYTGRVKSFENQIILNSQNRTMAFNVAEAGLMRALGVLTENPRWDGALFTEVMPGQGRFSVAGNWQNITRESSVLRLVTLQSTGISPDGLSTVVVQEQALLYSVIANPPDVPLIVAGGLDVSGNFEVVANPNGGGEGVPLSIWTDLDVDMNNGSGTTCGLQEFTDGNCSGSPYSEKGFQDLDILDNDPDFPDDLLEYIFNVPEAEWASLRAEADQTLLSCASLGPASVGLIWVDGDCQLNAGTIVGSATDPVILIVTDGDLTMNGGAEINGMVFSFRKPTTVAAFEVNMLGSARVNGVVASNHPVGHANGTYNSVYDANVLDQLQQHDAFQRVARVPGSWRDF
ncbi:PilX N-terminal domain-containing pilus assembly protein [Alteromonas gilva]|uniref:Type 4 fimbrial biogenesis protein PilX N-terminal domain-containing protein n=1 Tax=Alteromonas gilva TaxID=2987522 RepID=A0ABT5L779_9ALTE|nr:PilX N-terminal domain-containing pilus assembly protein [Alteromonas gilva]MDC8832738.1 hypothetical protein [Alteromonas gilva]